MDNIEISVVICTRNRPEYLKNCLTSISENSFLPLEVIVMDQSDNGEAKKVLDDILSIFPTRMQYMHMRSTGLTLARNQGIKASKGNVIAFTDDDCTADRNWLAAIKEEFEDPNINCVCGQTMPHDHLERPKPTLLSTLECCKRRVFKSKQNPIAIGRGNNMAFRRSELLVLGGFNEQIGVGKSVNAGDDFDILYRLLENSGTIVQTPNAVIFHSQPNDWNDILHKKRGYSMSVSALLACRVRYGDIYAGFLLAGKIAYELACLTIGGLLRFNRGIIQVGLRSFLGSISGLRYMFNKEFYMEVQRLSNVSAVSPINSKLTHVAKNPESPSGK